MNEVLKKLLLVIVSIFLFSSVGSLIPANADSKDIQGSQIIISTKLKDVSQSDIERMRKEAEKALKFIPPILGFEFNKKIKIRIVKKGECRIDRQNNCISLPIWHVRNKFAPIVQLISNVLVMPHQRVYEIDIVYRVGLGVFFQEKFGEDKSFYNYDNIPDLSLHDLVRMHRDNLMPLYWLKYKKRGYWEPEIIKLGFVESGSFISFLYEKYGD